MLDTSEAATELLEKRSSIYSGRSLLFLSSVNDSVFTSESRARMPMMNELMGWSFNFGFMPYGTQLVLFVSFTQRSFETLIVRRTMVIE